MKTLYLALGSNLGNREANIQEAKRALEALLKVPGQMSDIIETPSWGFVGEDFLNSVVRFDLPESGVDAELYLTALLREIKAIEAGMGRKIESIGNIPPDVKREYGNRTIDIDIIFFDSYRVDTALLTVPHPRAAERDFVMIPLRQVAGDKLKADFPEYFGGNARK